MDSLQSPSEGVKHYMSRMDIIADEAFNIIRFNLVVVGVYASIAVWISQSHPEVISAISGAYWILISAATWFMSILLVSIVYNDARRLSVISLYEDPVEKIDKLDPVRMSFNIRYSLLLTLISVISFSFALIDASSPMDVSIGDAIGALMILILIAAFPILIWHIITQILQKGRNFIARIV